MFDAQPFLATRSSALAGVTLAVVAVDELTKSLARAFLPLAEQIDGRGPRVAGLVGLERVQNAGSVGGVDQGRGLWMVVALGGLLITCLLGRSQLRRSNHAVTAAGLLLGGALGNVADRLATGGVTDFVALGTATHGAVLNGADIALATGALMLGRSLVARPQVCPSNESEGVTT
jgi:signal peptidase II